MHNTLTPHVNAYMRSRVALGIYGPKSVRVVTPRLMAFTRSFGRRPLDQLGPAAVERWLGELGHLATNSRAAYLVSLRAFTAWLVTTSRIDTDPCATIPAVKRVKPLPRSQPAEVVARTFAACRTDRERAIIWLMVGLGLRRMEVAMLRWEHYDEAAGLLEVRGSKNGKDRVLPVTDEVASALAKIRHGGTGPVIRSELESHRPISIERVGFLVRRIMERAQVKHHAFDGISAHALRHTAASDVLDTCGDLRVVQELLGHERLSTTAIYLRRRSASQMRDALGGRTYELPGAA